MTVPTDHQTGATTRQFPTWKTIKLGTGIAEDLLTSLLDGGVSLNRVSEEVLRKVTVLPTETEIELINLCGRDLGFDKTLTPKELYDRGHEFGLDLVPAEVGPQLRLQYRDQPIDGALLIAMEPIAAVFLGAESLYVFYVTHDDFGRWLHAAPVDGFWDPDDRWVFARHKPN